MPDATEPQNTVLSWENDQPVSLWAPWDGDIGSPPPQDLQPTEGDLTPLSPYNFL